MKQKDKRTVSPKLRFPEFREQWDEVQLSQLANSISDRVGTMPCIPYTVTSGLGLVSQEEKFGRTIAGNSLRNYIRLQKNDFAYNKSATKAYPEGYIARYLDEAKAAVPNSIFTCFRVDSVKVDPAYLDFLFAGNLHGRWLRKFLTIGARAHGSLNVSDDDLMALPVPLPSPPEQQKIADCLSSLDRVIAAEGRKLVALKAHKKGLMQQLFPKPGQTQPRLRFPEFRDDGEWGKRKLGSLGSFTGGGTPSKDNASYWDGSNPWVSSSDIFDDNIHHIKISRFISDEAIQETATKVVPANSILLVSRVGVGKLALVRQEICTSQDFTNFTPTKDNLVFLAYCLVAMKATFLSLNQGMAIKGFTKDDASNLEIPLPLQFEEQQKIADCFTALDDRIAAQAAKIEALKQHKRGLMQQLFPSPEEQ